jgi:hypothetical protein
MLMRRLALPLFACSTLALGGCVAGMAAGALGAAVQAGTKKSEIAEDLGPAAEEACRAQAAQHGAVHIIDVQRRDAGRITVWGTAGEGKTRRSFECRYDGKITSFKLRAITGS